MKIEVKDLSPVKKSLAIEADATEVAEETEQIVRRYLRQVKIPGFRPGKVPRALVESRFAKEIREDVRDRLLARLYTRATSEQRLEPLGDPIVEEVSFEENEPFRFRTTIEVRPEFTPGNYRGIEVREPPSEVVETDVDAALEELRRGQIRLIAEPGRRAATGDVVVADIEGTPDGGEPFRRERMLVEIGATGNLPAFNEGLTGALAGETREFSVVYPAEYDAKTLAGKRVAYRVVLHEVKRSELPALDDEFAKDLGEFETLSALRARIREDLEERKRQEARQVVRQHLVDALLLENPIPLPDVLVHEEIRHRLEDFARALVLQGVDPSKMELDWKQVRDRQEEAARRTVHARLVLDSIARAESIAVDAGEVEARLRAEAQRIGQQPAELRRRLSEGGGLEALKNQMVREKLLDFLTSVANIHREG